MVTSILACVPLNVLESEGFMSSSYLIQQITGRMQLHRLLLSNPVDSRSGAGRPWVHGCVSGGPEDVPHYLQRVVQPGRFPKVAVHRYRTEEGELRLCNALP